MTRSVDLLIVGAGPAGLAAAVRARSYNLDVLVVDEQDAPGGQIWRAAEASAEAADIGAFGDDYRSGIERIRAFRECGAAFEPETAVWQVEPGWQVAITHRGSSELIETRSIMLAPGALERPAPFPGWTLPGVLNVGAAQILLKTARQGPADPVWIAGSGPLVLLYAIQLLNMGERIGGILDTTPAGNRLAAIPHLPRALLGYKDLLKGLGWLNRLRREHVRVVRQVVRLEAIGVDALQSVRYRTAGGDEDEIPASTLLVHEGVIPNVHMTLALGCRHVWNQEQMCLMPSLDPWGETSVSKIFVAGDAGGIGGVHAACLRGEIAAIRIAARLERIDEAPAVRAARPLRRRLSRELAYRPFLDRLYRPRPEVFAPGDDVLVCRCEELTAGRIRRAASIGAPGVNQIKTLTRAGMGPCQGRQCGYSILHILAAHHRLSAEDVGFLRIRPPFAPVTVGELVAFAKDLESGSAKTEG